MMYCLLCAGCLTAVILATVLVFAAVMLSGRNNKEE